jgi:hypothetical protein
MREGRIEAPFTPEQVEALNAWQELGFVHPFTCGTCSNDLVAREEGWYCPTDGCGFTQSWAESYMADKALHPPAFPGVKLDIREGE